MKISDEIDMYLRRLMPITRSITGAGNRETLEVLQEIIPLTIINYKSGTQVYDWIIPDEWKISNAWIKDESGKKIVDFNKSNLHVVNYSEPVDLSITFDQLKDKLHYIEELPNAIPYRTSYYSRNWGFCVTNEQYNILSKTTGKLKVCIDSSFSKRGSLAIGELVIEGKSRKEKLISTYLCHPSMANDNLSGVILTAILARYMLQWKELEHTWRIIFVPETIGAIAYCAMNEKKMQSIDSALVVTTTGGPGRLGYKQSFNEEHNINHIIQNVLEKIDQDYITYPFDIHGSDERQFSANGFRINTASITKDKYYEYPYYHTSLDDLNFVTGQNISTTLKCYKDVVSRMDRDIVFLNTTSGCEVMLSKYNLYPKIGAAQLPDKNMNNELDARLWVLFYSDGKNSIEDIAIRTNISSSLIYKQAVILEKSGILTRIM